MLIYCCMFVHLYENKSQSTDLENSNFVYTDVALRMDIKNQINDLPKVIMPEVPNLLPHLGESPSFAGRQAPKMANSKIQLQNLSMAANQHPDACKKMKSTMVFTSKEDRISKLPDDILTNILSFLPTESSVATSVLAKRWNHVWSLVPNLDFSTKHRVCRVKRIRFAEFVDRVLLINKVSYVRKVCLHCIEDWDTARAIDCINATVTREATEIFDLQLPITFCNDVNTSHMNLVPTSFFHQKSLVTLKLGSIVLNVPSFVCFPSLENIVLQLVSFVDDDEGNALKNLLSGCPNLKSLFLRGGFLKDEKNIYICSTSLLDLKIDIGTDDEYLGYKAVIDAPNLRSIDLTDDAGTTFDIINASALVKATLCIRQHDEEPSHVCDKRLQALLLNISQVKELFLRTSTIKFLDDVESPVGFLPLFNNVAYLEVDMTGGSWWPVVPRLLHSMPNLVDFVIYLSHADESDSDNDLHEPLGLPHCLSTSLKKVKIVYVNDDDDDVEISLIYYLLKHAMSLKKASIHTRRLNLREAAEFIEELQKLRKSSGACEIKYKNMDNYARVISSHHIGT